MMRVSKFSAVLAITVLAACSGGTDKIGGQLAIVSELRETSKKNRVIRNSPQLVPEITRAFLDTVTVPTLEVTVEKSDQTAFLIPAAYRKDRRQGRVTVWKTVEGENVVVRSGVLIGTKGLGRDLVSADASAVIKNIVTKQSGGGLRVLHVRNDVNGADELRIQCEITVVGPESITIIERSYPTLHMNEKCVAGSGEISNDYWVDSAGDVRQSKQWAGPSVGYLSLRLLKK
jgi:hypothetical protein